MKDILQHLRNPSPRILDVFWRTLPKPIDIDEEDNKAAIELLHALAAAIERDLPS